MSKAQAQSKESIASLHDIERSTLDFSKAHDALTGVLTELNDEIDALKRKRMPLIKAAVRKAADLKAALVTQIDASRGLFEKPRTFQFHGVKVGLTKGKGGLEIEDEDRTLELIAKHFPDRVDDLVRVKRSPNKETLGELSAAELKKLAVDIKDTKDFPVVRPTTTEIDKAIKALLKDATEEALEQAA